MLVYYSIWIISLLVMSLPLSDKNGYKVKLIICFGLLFLFGAFRYDFGLDYASYEITFNKIHGQSHFVYNPLDRTEIGYSYFNFLCPSFRFLIIITSAIVCTAYYFMFWRYIPHKYSLLAMFLLYLSGGDTVFFMFSGIRNAIVISILILSIPLIEKKKLLYFSGVTVLAWSIHTSALIVFPIAYLLGCIKEISPKVANWMFIIAISLCLIPFDYLLSNSAQFVLANFDRYTTYIDNAEEIGKGASLLVSISNILLISFIGYGLCKSNLGHSKSLIVLLGLLAAYFPLLGPLDIRLSIYFSGIFIPAVIIGYSKIRDKFLRKSMIVLAISYKAYAFFVVWLNNPYFTYEEINNYVFDVFKF